MDDTMDRRPGQFADERFRFRVRRWRRRVAPIVFGAAIVVVLLSLGIAALLGADLSFYAGLGLGGAASLIMLLDAPPQHIESWRTGAEGERRTAKALKPLVREGWVVLHDLPRRFGNIDHVLIGPPGVFLLETKNLTGKLEVGDDELRVRWVDDPDDGYVNRSIAPRARDASARLSGELRSPAGRQPWVQAVVVLWGRFDQRTLAQNRVIWTHGDALETTLRAHTQERLAPSGIDQLADSIRAHTAALESAQV